VTVTKTPAGRLYQYIVTRVEHDKKMYLFIITVVIRFQGTAVDKTVCNIRTYIHVCVCVCVCVYVLVA
jgi:hypothetical protein